MANDQLPTGHSVIRPTLCPHKQRFTPAKPCSEPCRDVDIRGLSWQTTNFRPDIPSSGQPFAPISNVSTYTRPNTVAGSVEKHRELIALRDCHLAEVHKITVDVDHLDAVIRLFDPDADVSRLRGHVTKHKA